LQIVIAKNGLKFCVDYNYYIMEDGDIGSLDDSLVVGAKFTAHVLCTIRVWIYETVIDISQSEMVQSIALNGLFLYSRMAVQLENIGKYCYANNEHVRSVVDSISYISEKTRLFFSNARREPENCNWIHTCSLHNSPHGAINYFETYQTLNKNTPFNEAVQLFEEAFQSIRKSGASVIMKHNDTYSVLTDLTERVIEDKSEPVLSTFRPLSITYKRADSDNIIDIKLDRNMWCVGNEMFSASFVRRCLEYQEQAFLFSMNYEIEIMDADVNVIFLNSNQYIEVAENEIVIKTMGPTSVAEVEVKVVAAESESESESESDVEMNVESDSVGPEATQYDISDW
jgi:hypothetical protein